MAQERDIAEPSGGAKRARIGWLAPLTIFGFIALVLVGTYYVRLSLLEKAIISASELDDSAAVVGLANSFPCPVNARSNSGWTPLYYAVLNRRPDQCRLFLSKGADVNARDNSESTPLHWAAYNSRPREIVELLIAAGADVNARQGPDFTPLHVAAMTGSREAAECLIVHGADVNARDRRGRTPLACALEENDGDMAGILREAGAKE